VWSCNPIVTGNLVVSVAKGPIFRPPNSKGAELFQNFYLRKANIMLILSIFLNQKSSEYFPRKTYSNLTRNLKFLNLRPVFRYISTLCVIHHMKMAI
jgi:hypothetical protein